MCQVQAQAATCSLLCCCQVEDLSRDRQILQDKLDGAIEEVAQLEAKHQQARLPESVSGFEFEIDADQGFCHRK